MQTSKSYKEFSFDDFNCSIIEDPMVHSSFYIDNQSFQNDLLRGQIHVFNKLEKNLPFSSAPSFEQQVHFQQAYLTPVQRWFPYREGYSIKLVTAFLNELKISGSVFDPFAGSGTTLLAARHKNLLSYGIDVNPISALVALVENELYTTEDIEEIKKAYGCCLGLYRSDEIYDSSFDLAAKMFNDDILQAILQFKVFINNISNIKVKRLFFVSWLSIIEEVSNIKKEGNGIKYKNRKRLSSGYVNIPKEEWETKHFPADKFGFVKQKLLEKIKLCLSDIQNEYGAINIKPVVHNYDCLRFEEIISDEFQFTFFSPPYCNCFDYFEIHKVELWLGDFIKDKNGLKQMREMGFRSNTNALNSKPILYSNENIEELISLFHKDALWNKHIPSVVRGYFDDMHTLLQKLYNQTLEGGYVGIVIGNSAYSNVIIPSDILTAKIGEEIGFSVENIFVSRHLTTSSQQKKVLEPLKNYLRESIVLLKK